MDLQMDVKSADTVLWRHLSLPCYTDPFGAHQLTYAYSLFSWFPGLHRYRISVIQVSIVKPLKELIQATACRLVKYGLKSLHDAL